MDQGSDAVLMSADKGLDAACRWAVFGSGPAFAFSGVMELVSASQQPDLRTGRIWLDSEGILHSEVNPHVELDLEDAKERVRLMGIAGQGKQRPVLVDLRRVLGMTREARQYYSGPECARVNSAAALVVGSPLGKAIGNFFLGLNRSVIPTKLFSDEATATTWLRSFL